MPKRQSSRRAGTPTYTLVREQVPHGLATGGWCGAPAGSKSKMAEGVDDVVPPIRSP